MKTNIKIITDPSVWNAFLHKHTNGTFHQSWEWGDMHESLGHKTWSLGVYEDTKLITVCLVIKIQAVRATFLHVPHGPIFHSACDKLRVLKSLTEYLKAVGQEEKCSFIRFAPTLERTEKNTQYFKTAGFRPAPIFVQSELSLVLDIKPPEEELLKNMRKSTRSILKKASRYNLRYAKTSSPHEFANFFKLYENTVQHQGFVGHNSTFIKQEYLSFLKTKSSSLYFAYYKNRPISTALIIHQNRTGFYHYGASERNEDNVPSSHLLQWYIIKDLKSQGMTAYNFWGVAPKDKHNHPWRGLTIFKEGFGGVRKEYTPTQDYVLSSFYWFSWLIESIRKRRRGY